MIDFLLQSENLNIQQSALLNDLIEKYNRFMSRNMVIYIKKLIDNYNFTPDYDTSDYLSRSENRELINIIYPLLNEGQIELLLELGVKYSRFVAVDFVLHKLGPENCLNILKTKDEKIYKHLKNYLSSPDFYM
jgi:hypothetical protein